MVKFWVKIISSVANTTTTFIMFSMMKLEFFMWVINTPFSFINPAIHDRVKRKYRSVNRKTYDTNLCHWCLNKAVVDIGVVAIGTLGTQALPDKERNLSTRNQKLFKYWSQYKKISSWCLEGYHFQINACPCLLFYDIWKHWNWKTL